MPSLTRTGDVFVLDLGDAENRFHPDWVAQVNAALDEVVAAEGPRALVTAATGKFWSIGLDLEWVAANTDKFAEYATAVHELLARMLELPVPTVAALQGHTFAAGAMFALAHDFRVMRVDRGFFCMPEVDINIPFTPGMSALIRSRLQPQVAHEVMTTGRRYGGPDALASAIVDATAGDSEVLKEAVERAAALASKAAPVLGAIKARMYAAELAELREPSAGLTPVG
ncbi:MAG TPA: enoyl-CoA hydratase-related protein [Propionibacteriaceae bacterium]|nr:enoyl-CoA hydratase-related protein [Propionibacteriaceae bacterium]